MPWSSFLKKSLLLAEVFVFNNLLHIFLLPEDLEDSFSLCVFIYESRLFVINTAVCFQTHVWQRGHCVAFYFLFKQKLPVGLPDKRFVQEGLQQLSWAASGILAMSRRGIILECSSFEHKLRQISRLMERNLTSPL